MNPHPFGRRYPRFADVVAGFTLTEMAIVLVIVAVLIGGMLIPLSAQTEARRTDETRRHLADIREALLGHAIINGRLPCPMPTAVTDPANAAYGVAAATCAPGAEGLLPWKTLGMPESDAWGTRRTAAADPFAGYWRYRIDDNFSTAFTLTTGTTSALAVWDAAGNRISLAAEAPVAIVFSTGPDRVANGRNAVLDADYQGGEPSAGFDDLLIWIGRPLLFNRMVGAGKLP